VSDEQQLVPVWTLSNEDGPLPQLFDGPMDAGRLDELRSVLTMLVSRPVATLERHPLPEDLDYSSGMTLDAASPLARHLADLVAATTQASGTASTASAAQAASTLARGGGEALYRMVVPAKVAAQMGTGLFQPMASKVAVDGIHSALTGGAGRIAAQATFVPVAAEGAAAGAGGFTSVGLGAISAPLIFMAVSASLSAYADYQRQQQMAAITKLLHQLRAENLDKERTDLEACRPAIDKATALLLDKGVVGHALGLDAASHAINGAVASAEDRLRKWRQCVSDLTDKKKSKGVEAGRLVNAFEGIDTKGGGLFAAHLELARLAILLRRRLLLLQAVEAAQQNAGNELETFMKSLKADQDSIDRLDRGIAEVLKTLSELQLERTHRWNDMIFTSQEVDSLLRRIRRVRAVGDGIALSRPAADLAIEIVEKIDGTLVVFPALARVS
jgi:hypothetical protein